MTNADHLGVSDAHDGKTSGAHRVVLPTTLTVLVFIEDPVMRVVCCETVTHMGFRAEQACSITEAKGWLRTGLIDIAVIQIPFQGDVILDFLSDTHQQWPDTALITIGTATAVCNVIEAIHRGASDYIPIPFTMEELSYVLENSANKCAARIEQLRCDPVVPRPSAARRLVYKSRSMEAMVRILPRIAESTHPVLIAGEAGTGKERVARVLHEMSADAGRPFIAVDCTSSDFGVLEAELFGQHTDTDRCSDCKQGSLAGLDGGSVFLDEIGALPPQLQSRLIQTIRDREVIPRGCTRSMPLTTRVIAATGRDLSAMVMNGAFRKDLFYRLNVVCLRIPPLRERREDIPLLTASFLHQNRLAEGRERPLSLANDFLRAMMAYDWPGNVRELENVVARACTLARHTQLRLCDLPTLISMRVGQAAHKDGRNDQLLGIMPLREVEHQAILNALTLCGGDKREAARRLGIGKSTLYRKLIDFGHTVAS